MPPPETCNETEVAGGLGEKKALCLEMSFYYNALAFRLKHLVTGYRRRKGEESIQGLIEGMSAEFVFNHSLVSRACMLLISIRRKARNLSLPPETADRHNLRAVRKSCHKCLRLIAMQVTEFRERYQQNYPYFLCHSLSALIKRTERPRRLLRFGALCV